MTNKITTFEASDSLVRAIAFGGDHNGTEFLGEDFGGARRWEDVKIYDGAIPKGAESAFLGYVVYDDDADAPASFWWELNWAEDVLQRLENGSIGKVTLTREIFEANITT